MSLGKVMAKTRKYRYAIVPGIVHSKYDGDAHYVTAPQIARLYGVDFCDCIVIGIDDPYMPEQAEFDGLVVLRPDPTGRYRLPGPPAAWFNNNEESEHGSVLGVVSI